MNAKVNLDAPAKGLEGVVVDNTAVSHVDGQAGTLYYRGYPIEALANRRFAEVAYLVVFGELPNAQELERFEAYLWQAGQLPVALIAALEQLVKVGGHPMAILQALMPLMAVDAPSITMGRSPDESEGLLVAARLPTAIAALHALQNGRAVPPYSASRRYGERFLEMLNAAKPTPDAVDVYERTQLLQLEHSFNASTFTARVVTSSLAPPASALSAAMGSLYGPLHGAADQGAIEMANEAQSPERALEFVRECLANKRRVMGMGHREYRVVDPRAKVIKPLAEKIAQAPEYRNLFQTLIAIESAFLELTADRSRALRANVDFYKGVVYLSLGIPKELFTANFSAARVFGWVAHIVEQRQDNRIIRPAAKYVGPAPRGV